MFTTPRCISNTRIAIGSPSPFRSRLELENGAAAFSRTLEFIPQPVSVIVIQAIEEGIGPGASLLDSIVTTSPDFVASKAFSNSEAKASSNRDESPKRKVPLEEQSPVRLNSTFFSANSGATD